MNLHNIMAMNYILALIKRDDGERILLGAGAYEFKEEQQHFAANIIANDVIEKQGTDGQLLAGQVRRSASQLFTGYVGDETISRLEAETYRRRFLQFFQTNHFYTVVYILADGRAIQRKTGYLTEAPSVPELYQQTPEYSVALAFQDVNYYTYNENEAGEEIFGRSYELDPEGVLKGGLAWDQIGAIWTDYVWQTTQLEPIATFNFKDLSQLRIRELLGRTQQERIPNQNLWNSAPENRTSSWDSTVLIDNENWITIAGINTFGNFWTKANMSLKPASTYYYVLEVKSVTVGRQDDRLAILSDLPSSQVDNGGVDFNLLYKDLKAGGIYSGSFQTKASFSGCTLMLRSYARPYNTNASITFRLTITEQEPDLDTFSYLPFVGNYGAPNPNYPTAIESVTGSQITSAHGKNLFIPVVNTGGGYTRSYDPKTGEYKIEGTSANTWTWLTNQSPIMLKAGEPYTFSRNTNTQFTLWIRGYYADGTYDTDSSFSFGNSMSVTRTMPRDVVKIVLQAQQAGDVTCNLKVQIEAGETATAFEPAWTQDQEIDLGKNLINPATVVKGGIDTNTGEIIQPTGVARTTPFIRVQPGEIYTVKGQGNFGWTTIAYYTANKTFISRPDNPDGTFTIPDGAFYIRKTCAEGALLTAQLEKGGTATEYSARRPLGRNLFKPTPKMTAPQGITVKLSELTGEFAITGTSTTTYANLTDETYFPFPAGTYTLSLKDGKTLSHNVAIRFKGAGMTQIDLTVAGGSKSATITIPAGYTNTYLFMQTGGTGKTFNESFGIQLERGAKANAFERYFDRIELHQIGEYRDTLFKDQSTGKWYFNRQTDAVELTADDTSSAKSTWDSTVPRIYIAASALGQIADPIFPLTDDEPVAAYTDRFEAKSFADVYTNKKGGFASSPTAHNWQFSSLDWTDQATARAELTGTVIRFARRIEETLEIADPTLIAQLNNTGGEFKGEVTAEIHSQDLAAYSTAESSDGRTGGALWTEGGERGSNTVNVEGIGKVQPTWTVYGPAASPYIENVTTNQRLEYIGEIEDGQKLVVDTRQQIATIDGHLVTGNIRGQWIELQRGDNIIRYGGDKVDEPSTIEWDEVIE